MPPIQAITATMSKRDSKKPTRGFMAQTTVTSGAAMICEIIKLMRPPRLSVIDTQDSLPER